MNNAKLIAALNNALKQIHRVKYGTSLFRQLGENCRELVGKPITGECAVLDQPVLMIGLRYHPEKKVTLILNRLSAENYFVVLGAKDHGFEVVAWGKTKFEDLDEEFLVSIFGRMVDSLAVHASRGLGDNRVLQDFWEEGMEAIIASNRGQLPLQGQFKVDRQRLLGAVNSALEAAGDKKKPVELMRKLSSLFGSEVAPSDISSVLTTLLAARYEDGGATVLLEWLPWSHFLLKLKREPGSDVWVEVDLKPVDLESLDEENLFQIVRDFGSALLETTSRPERAIEIFTFMAREAIYCIDRPRS